MGLLKRASTIAAFSIAGTLASGCGPTAQHETRLNLIVISLDTVRADRLSSYGYERPTTPHLDAFAESAVVFTNCVAQSTATAASHMSMFTGQYVHRHGLTDNTEVRIPDATLASALRDAGWRTAAFTGHGSLQAKLGHDVGFEVFESEPAGGGGRRASRNLPEVVPQALAWLERVPSDEPFFMFVHGYDPHCPYAPPGMSVDDADVELTRACGMPQWGPLMARDDFGAAELERLSELYDAELTAADTAIGGFLDELEDRGMLERSIVVFTSDHGEVLGNHDWVGHTRLWEEEIRVPLLIRFPDGRFARRLDDPVQHVDLAPTLLSALSVEVPDGVQGANVMARIRDETSKTEERMRITQIGPRVAVRFDDRFKLVAGPDKRAVASGQPQGFQLYDLANDPDEHENLYVTAEGRARFDELWTRYRRWLRDTREDDARFRGATAPLDDAEEHRKTLRTLGYVGDESR